VGELIIQDLKVEYTLPSIKLDITELTKSIEILKKQYSNWVVSEDDIESATKTVAQLNKVAKSISDERIRIAKSIKLPIDEMESQLKEQTKIVTELSKSIKDYLDIYEQKRKDDLYDYYTSLPEWEDYMIFPDRWFNKTAKEIVVINEMKNQRSEHDRNVKLIEMSCGDLTKDNYIKLLNEKCDITDIIQRINEDKELLSKSTVKQENVVKNDLPTFNGKITKDYTITCEEHTHELIKEFLKEMNAEWK